MPIDKNGSFESFLSLATREVSDSRMLPKNWLAFLHRSLEGTIYCQEESDDL